MGHMKIQGYRGGLDKHEKHENLKNRTFEKFRGIQQLGKHAVRNKKWDVRKIPLHIRSHVNSHIRSHMNAHTPSHTDSNIQNPIKSY